MGGGGGREESVTDHGRGGRSQVTDHVCITADLINIHGGLPSFLRSLNVHSLLWCWFYCSIVYKLISFILCVRASPNSIDPVWLD